jgi:alkanesulfonate monooxygenase SsuD/methylene tetrahydromethanopterin reductase-like flavin-dependent oxidoreductase (luciferase family)
VRFGISVPNIGQSDRLVALGVEADVHGWDGFFLWDHMRFSATFAVPVVDPWVLLAAVATRTSRVRLGTLITPVARRRPWKLARETVTLDHLSGGRVILGAGLGTPRDADFASLGEDPDDRVRAEKLDEGLAVLTRLWSGEPFSFDGRYLRITDVAFAPTPVQMPRIPIWIGGAWPNRAPFRRAARWDGVVPMAHDPDGAPREVTPGELAEIVGFVGAHRATDGAFDVAAAATGVDDQTIAAFEQAGATWYLPEPGTQGPGWEDEVMAIVRAGPPRGSGA